MYDANGLLTDNPFLDILQTLVMHFRSGAK